MALTLYVDVVNKKLLKTANGPFLETLPPFFFGTEEAVIIYPREPNPVRDRDNPYIEVDWEDCSISLAIGVADADDATVYAAATSDFGAFDVDGKVEGTLDLNTQGVVDLLEQKSSVQTFLEITATPDGGSAEVVVQLQVELRGVVIDPAGPPPSSLPDFLSKFVNNEVPAGTVNGINLVFTLANTPLAGTVSLFQNGLLMKLAEDYTISGLTITFITAPETDSLLLANYIK